MFPFFLVPPQFLSVKLLTHWYLALSSSGFWIIFPHTIFSWIYIVRPKVQTSIFAAKRTSFDYKQLAGLNWVDRPWYPLTQRQNIPGEKQHCWMGGPGGARRNKILLRQATCCRLDICQPFCFVLGPGCSDIHITSYLNLRLSEYCNYATRCCVTFRVDDTFSAKTKNEHPECTFNLLLYVLLDTQHLQRQIFFKHVIPVT